MSGPFSVVQLASTAAIREQFPALAREEQGLPVAYFDGPGGTQVPRAVGDALLDYLYGHNANTHWAYPSSAETDHALAHARSVFAGFFNGTPDEVVFGANMTTLTHHVARALGLEWGPGDEVVVTDLDHHANIDPWRALERERGVTVRSARFESESGALDLEHCTSLINKHTRLVAVGAASNALGTVTEVAAVAALARDVGALVFVDGVHLAQHTLPDVAELDCDFFACSAYKFYGPHVGVLWMREAVLARLPFATLEPAAHTGPERAESGTLNHEGIVGAAAAVDWIASLAGRGRERDRRQGLRETYDGLHARSTELLDTLWTGLSALSGVRLYGPPPGRARTPTVAFTVDGMTATDVARRLGGNGVYVSHGDFYALTVIRRLGLEPEGLVRAGCACYTTSEDVERLMAGVEECAR